MPPKVVSIILCNARSGGEPEGDAPRRRTRPVPADLAAEVLVVDNGSRDRTRPVVRQAKVWGRSPRYLYEPRPGLSSRGTPAWPRPEARSCSGPTTTCGPAARGSRPCAGRSSMDRADAVAGRIKLAATWSVPGCKAMASGLPGGRCPDDGRFRSDRRQHGLCPPRAGEGARLRSGTWRRGPRRRWGGNALFPAASDGRLSPRGGRRRLDRRASLRRASADATVP